MSDFIFPSLSGFFEDCSGYDIDGTSVSFYDVILARDFGDSAKNSKIDCVEVDFLNGEILFYDFEQGESEHFAIFSLRLESGGEL